MSNQYPYNDVERDLIKAVTDTALPVFVTGKTGSGFRLMSEFVAEVGNYTLIEETYENFEQRFETFSRVEKIRSLRNKVFVLMGDTRRDDFEKFVGDHISIKTILTSDGEHFFQISPAVGKSLLKRLTLNRDRAFHVEKDWKSNSRIPVNFNNGYSQANNSIVDLELVGLDGLLKFNQLVGAVTNLTDLVLQHKDGYINNPTYCIALYVPYDLHHEINLSKVRSLTDDFDKYRTAVAVFLEREEDYSGADLEFTDDLDVKPSQFTDAELADIFGDQLIELSHSALAEIKNLRIPVVVNSYDNRLCEDLASTLSIKLGYGNLSIENRMPLLGSNEDHLNQKLPTAGQISTSLSDEGFLISVMDEFIYISINDYVEETNSYIVTFSLRNADDTKFDKLKETLNLVHGKYQDIKLIMR